MHSTCPKCLIVSAHAVYPAPNTAEGVVNAAWLDALREQWKVELVTSPHGYQPLAAPGANWRPVPVYTGAEEPRRVMDVVAAWRTRFSRWHLLGMVARLADRGSRALSLMPVRMSMWVVRASRHILALQEGTAQPLPVWARGTPPESFQAAILAYRQRPFPLVVNYNDPMPHCLLWDEKIGKLTPTLDRLQHRQNSFFAQYAQAFTFPSRRLAELMATAAGLDRRRCFIVPHLTPHPPPLSAPPLEPGLWVIYAGSFYPSVFSDTVKAGLAQYAQNGGILRFLFVLKRPPPAIRSWIEATLPNVKVLTDLPPAAITGLKQQAVAELIVDSARHAPLLRTKVAEAVQKRICILALAPAETTTAEVASAAGGMIISPVSVDTVVDGLRQAEQLLVDPTFAATANRQRELVAARFSETRVITDSTAIIDYACHRFAWQQAGSTGAEPEPPQIEAWP